MEGIIRTRGRRLREGGSGVELEDCEVDEGFDDETEFESPVGVDGPASWPVLGFDLKSGCEVHAGMPSPWRNFSVRVEDEMDLGITKIAVSSSCAL